MRVMTAPSPLALMGFSDPDAPPPVSRMACMLHSLCTQLVELVPELERGFVNTPLGGPRKYSAYTVDATFSELHMDIVLILANLVSMVPERVLDKLTPLFWRVASKHFLAHPHNNVYHARFFRIFTGILTSSYYQDETLGALLGGSGGFLDAMIEHYVSGGKTSARGFIVTMLNVLRLKADSQPADAPLPSLLATSDAYCEFLPTLESVTRAYTLRAFPDIARVAPHVYPGISPSTVTYTADGHEQPGTIPTVLKMDRAKPHPQRAHLRKR